MCGDGANSGDDIRVEVEVVMVLVVVVLQREEGKERIDVGEIKRQT